MSLCSGLHGRQGLCSLCLEYHVFAYALHEHHVFAYMLQEYHVFAYMLQQYHVFAYNIAVRVRLTTPRREGQAGNFTMSSMFRQTPKRPTLERDDGKEGKAGQDVHMPCSLEGPALPVSR